MLHARLVSVNVSLVFLGRPADCLRLMIYLAMDLFFDVLIATLVGASLR